MNRRDFIRNTTLAASALTLLPTNLSLAAEFPVVRTPGNKRHFKSVAVERAITKIKTSIGNK
jgi:hypothetical protein